MFAYRSSRAPSTAPVSPVCRPADLPDDLGLTAWRRDAVILRRSCKQGSGDQDCLQKPGAATLGATHWLKGQKKKTKQLSFSTQVQLSLSTGTITHNTEESEKLFVSFSMQTSKDLTAAPGECSVYRGGIRTNNPQVREKQKQQTEMRAIRQVRGAEKDRERGHKRSSLTSRTQK